MKNSLVLKAAAQTVIAEYRNTGSYDEETDREILEHIKNTVCMPGLGYIPGAAPLEIDDAMDAPVIFAFAIVLDAHIDDIVEVLA